VLKQHEVLVWFLFFVILSLKGFYPILSFVCAFLLGVYYVNNFGKKGLLVCFPVAVFLTVVFSGKPLERIVFIENEFGKTVAITSHHRRIKVNETVKVGDVVKDGIVVSSNDPVSFVLRIRAFLRERILDSFEYPAFGLLEAVCLGLKDELPKRVKEDFSRAGIYHFLAISGLHVGVAIGFLAWLLRFLKVKDYPFWSCVAGIPIVLFAGMLPSAVRALLFAILLSYGQKIKREVSPVYLLGLISIFGVLTGAGLSGLLSVLATFGVILGLRSGKKLGIFVYPFVAVLPVNLTVFGKVNLLSPLNTFLFSIPFTLFLCFAILSEIFLFSARILNDLVSILGMLNLNFAHVLAKISSFAEINLKISPEVAYGTYILCLAIFLFGKKSVNEFPTVERF